MVAQDPFEQSYHGRLVPYLDSPFKYSRKERGIHYSLCYLLPDIVKETAGMIYLPGGTAVYGAIAEDMDAFSQPHTFDLFLHVISDESLLRVGKEKIKGLVVRILHLPQ